MKRPSTIRERIARAVFPQEQKRLEQAYDLLMEAYRWGPAVLSPATLERSLQEIDSQWIDMIMRQRGYTIVSGQGMGGGLTFTETDRLRAVEESRRMYHYNVQTQRGVTSWTDFGFGQEINIVATDPVAQGIIDEFWTARRNSPLLKQRRLQQQSNTQVVDGEIFYVCYVSTTTGLVTLRRFPTETVTKIIYANDDPDIALFYVRSEGGESVLYPDWMITDEQMSGYELKSGERIAGREKEIAFSNGDQLPATQVRTIHAAFDERNLTGEMRGWPTLLNTLTWSRAYTQILEDRATINKWLATFVDELIHKGGSRANDEIMAKFASTLNATTYYDSNAPAASGSLLVHNDQIERRRLPLNSAAGDASTDSGALLGQVTAGDGVPGMWRGRPDMMNNRATAQVMERPWLEQMQRYQTFWYDVFSDIAAVVLESASEYGNQQIEDYSVEVLMQSPFVLYPDDASALLGAISNAATAMALDPRVATNAANSVLALAFTGLGMQDPASVLDEEEPEKKPSDTEPGERESVIGKALENYRSGSVDYVTMLEYLVDTGA